MLHFIERLSESVKSAGGRSHPALGGNPKSETSASNAQSSNLKSEISNFKSEVSSLTSLAESCPRQIRAWADSLQNSDIRGQRHLNDQSRAAYEINARADVFWKQLEADHQRRLDAWAEAAQQPA